MPRGSAKDAELYSDLSRLLNIREAGHAFAGDVYRRRILAFLAAALSRPAE